MNHALQAPWRARARRCFSGIEIDLDEDFARGPAKGAILPEGVAASRDDAARDRPITTRPEECMSANRAVVVDPEAPGRLVIKPVPEPVPDRGEAIVAVRALSLNRGEVRRSTMAPAGWRPGWDLAGVIERGAPDGSGPRAGARVVGFLPEGAWAERVVVPAHALAELPEKVTFSQAATFPVAGLTALHALGKNGPRRTGRRGAPRR